MARHSQKQEAPKFVCSACKENECKDCIDVTRMGKMGMEKPLCTDRRPGHKDIVEKEVVDLVAARQQSRSA